MKKIVVFVIGILFCALNIENSCAQNIVDDLQSQTNDSDGVISIESDPAVTALIGKPSALPDASNGNGDYTERQGYRIQAFMGTASNARSEATSKQTSIRSAFPELPAYLIFDAPNWKLLVGDFMTREEANIAKQRLQKEFPQFGKEMYIVSVKIKLPVER